MNKSITLVTMFFDLSKLKDKSSQTRDMDFYLKNCKATLSQKYPMIIFCDDTTKTTLQKIRETESNNSPTVYIVKSIIDYDIYSLHWKTINNNKVKILQHNNIYSQQTKQIENK